MNHFLFTSPSKISNLMKVNFNSTVHMSQILSKFMIKKKYGRIINFSSVAVPLGLEVRLFVLLVNLLLILFLSVYPRN